MHAKKLMAGCDFPQVKVMSLEGGELDISSPGDAYDWRVLIVYRGKHCPLCTKYLNNLEGFKNKLHELNIDLVAVSGDSKQQLETHLQKLTVSFPLYYGLTIEQMKQLGLYISHPRSEQETDHPFPEPGLFVINENGSLQVVDISNNPFARPSIESLVSGLEWIRKNDYPIRGTYK